MPIMDLRCNEANAAPHFVLRPCFSFFLALQRWKSWQTMMRNAIPHTPKSKPPAPERCRASVRAHPQSGAPLQRTMGPRCSGSPAGKGEAVHGEWHTARIRTPWL